MKYIYSAFLVLTLFFAGMPSARADYFVWQDSESGLSFSFPDTWKVVSDHQPDDLLTIMAPSGRAHASCRIRVRDDGRYQIFPPRYDDAVQKVDVSLSFWDQYLQEFEEGELYKMEDTSGLGRGYASYAVAGYEDEVQGPYMKRQALMFASLYHDKIYILECSSHRDAFVKWQRQFLSIAQSVDFKAVHHPFRNGYYRDFLQEGDPEIITRNHKRAVLH